MQDRSELERLVESVRSGERLILLAPGIFHLIATILALITATVFLIGGASVLLGRDLPVGQVAAIQLSSLALVFAFVVLPGLMLFRGNKAFTRWHYYFGLFLAVAGCIGAAIALLSGITSPIPFVVSTTTGGIGMVLTHSPGYRTCSDFYYLLRQAR